MREESPSASEQVEKGRVLIVDDEKDFVINLMDILESRGYRCVAVHSVMSALEKIKEFDAQVALLDIRLGDADGIDLITGLKAERPELLCVMMTAYATIDTAIKALQQGAYNYLRKPFDPQELLEILERCFEKIQLKEEKAFADAALRDSEGKYRLLVDNLDFPLTVYDADGRISMMNVTGTRNFGLRPEDVAGKSLYDFFPYDAHVFVERARQIFQSGAGLEFEDEVPLPSGNRWFYSNLQPVKDPDGVVIAVQTISQDITERKQAEEKIKRSLAEKVVLLREIHHRVKNNLQIISSLLNLQAEYIKDKKSLVLFKESIGRIKAMAILHEKLYLSEDLGRIDFAEYIRSLLSSLMQSYEEKSRSVSLRRDVENITKNIDKAIPCGLIINELVTNSLKHAFPGERKGEILIEASSNEDNLATLTVSDNGIGFPEGIDIRNTESLGMQLVITLVNQLEGTIELVERTGTMFRIIFPTDESG